MAETPPKNLCFICRKDVVEGQLLCPACLAAVGMTEIKTDAPGCNDGEIRAGEPPEHRPIGDAPALGQSDIRMGPPTPVGCVLVAVCVLIIAGVAIPVVQWRDPDTGQGLPRMVAVLVPVVIGAVCYAIAAGICNLLGVRLNKEGAKTRDERVIKPPTR